MAIDFAAFMAKFILALIVLKMLEVHLVRVNPDSASAQAFAFLLG